MTTDQNSPFQMPLCQIMQIRTHALTCLSWASNAVFCRKPAITEQNPILYLKPARLKLAIFSYIETNLILSMLITKTKISVNLKWITDSYHQVNHLCRLFIIRFEEKPVWCKQLHFWHLIYSKHWPSLIQVAFKHKSEQNVIATVAFIFCVD